MITPITLARRAARLAHAAMSYVFTCMMLARFETLWKPNALN